MLHYPYFKENDEYYNNAVQKVYNDLSEINEETYLAIGKLNESQFFLFLANYISYFQFTDIDITTLQHFFCYVRNYELEINEPLPLPFQDDYVEVNKEEIQKVNPEQSLTFNCRQELSELITFYFEMREYPKETQSHMLLVLSDKIYEHISYPLYIFKSGLIDYVDNVEIEDKNFDVKKISFLLEINVLLENYENDLKNLQAKIQKKVIDLTKSKNGNKHVSKNGNYQINIESIDLQKLYHSLEKNMFIDQNKISLNQFMEVLENDWESHNSIIYLEMDNILFKYFIDFLETYFDTKLQLSTIEYSAKIANKNGIIKAGAIYSSMAQYRKFTKKRDDIKILKSMFEKIKKSLTS